MSFHLGKPILVMLIVSILSGTWIALRPSPKPADLVLWTFTSSHAQPFRSIVGQFEKQTGKTVDIQLISSRARDLRLESLFMSDQSSRVLPDLVEVEISRGGKFVRPPVDEIGFLPLNDYLHEHNWDQRILATRFAPWSLDGQIFGVPHDVHPVTISYRKDLFDEAGIDLEQAKTWPQFQDMCVRFQDYWRAHGYPTRHAIEMAEGTSDLLTVMLLQRGVNVVDPDGTIHINEPIVANTMAVYTQMVAGPRKIASESAAAGTMTGNLMNDAREGNLCAFFTPDWRVFQLRQDVPSLSGKMHMMPLPKFEPTDAPTSTWGGTMIGITRNSPHHDDAWNLIEFLYLSQAGLEARQKVTTILPPVIEWWNDPAYHAGEPYFGGQKIYELYVSLARQIPKRYVTPVTPIALAELSFVLNLAVDHERKFGNEGLEKACQHWLDLATDDLKARVKHGQFQDEPR